MGIDKSLFYITNYGGMFSSDAHISGHGDFNGLFCIVSLSPSVDF